MDFAAIDFETANHRPDSACQVAVVLVEGGKVVAEHSWLIRPPDLFFSEQCVAVHGIYPSDVEHEPEWENLWPEVWDKLQGRTVLAHNAMFDARVLQASLHRYEIECPRIEFQCTRLIARRSWPGRFGYGLKSVADMLSIDFQHHVALEDSRTCASIAIAAAAHNQVTTLSSLESRLFLERGFIEGVRRINPRTRRRVKSAKPSVEVPVQQVLDQCASTKPFDGKRFFLQGSLLGMTREKSESFLVALGAIVDKDVTEATDFWLIGSSRDDFESSQDISASPKSTRHSDAVEESIQRYDSVSTPSHSPNPTRVVTQRQFWAMIPGGIGAMRQSIDTQRIT